MPSINQQGRETDKVVLPEDAVVVPPEQAHEYGYWGVRPDTTPEEEYTFAAGARRHRERYGSGQSGQQSGQRQTQSSGESDSGRHAGQRAASRGERSAEK